MKFSVVIPLYNKEKEIKRSIDSVLRQTYSEYEIIVVNDGSKDNGPDIVQKMDDRRIRLIHQKNAGVSAARNRGIMEARFDYVSFLDADDEWKPNYLEIITKNVHDYPNAGIYATAYGTIDENGSFAVPVFKGVPPGSWRGYLPSYFYSALGPPPVWTSAVTIRKDVFDNVGMFPEGIVMAEDKEMWERIALKYKICFTTEIGAIYYLDASNRSCHINVKANRERPFIGIGKKALGEGSVAKEVMPDLENYLAYCQIQQAKVQMVHLRNSEKARLILSNTYANKHSFNIEKRILYALSFMPDALITFLWNLSQRIKGSD